MMHFFENLVYFDVIYRQVLLLAGSHWLTWACTDFVQWTVHSTVLYCVMMNQVVLRETPDSEDYAALVTIFIEEVSWFLVLNDDMNYEWLNIKIFKKQSDWLYFSSWISPHVPPDIGIALS